jgi:hypothetical protein
VAVVEVWDAGAGCRLVPDGWQRHGVRQDVGRRDEPADRTWPPIGGIAPKTRALRLTGSGTLLTPPRLPP